MAKVLVTGGAGFIGAHLVTRLAERGDEVIVVDNMIRGSAAKLSPLLDGGAVHLIVEDIRRFDALRQIVRGCDVVYHLAAQSNVMGALGDPEFSVTTNVLGTYNVLRSAAEARVTRVVFASSREVYGDPLELPVREDHPLLAKNPYGASKVAGEAYCRTFANTHRLPVEVVRLANVYGPGDAGRVIPLWLSAAQEGRDLEVYGGQQVIDFLWVGTAVEALLHAGQHGLSGPVNIGTGAPTRILDLARRVLAVTGSRSKIVRTAAREVEVAKFVADTRLMCSLGLLPERDPLQHLAEVAEMVRRQVSSAHASGARRRPGSSVVRKSN
jgi:UDP-glucose 4-epimerase